MSYTYRWRPEPHESHKVEGFDDRVLRVTCMDRVVEVDVGIGGHRHFVCFRVLDLWQMMLLQDGVWHLLGAKIEKLVSEKFIYLDVYRGGDKFVPSVDAILAATTAVELIDRAYYSLLFQLRAEVAEHFPVWDAFVRRAISGDDKP